MKKDNFFVIIALIIIIMAMAALACEVGTCKCRRYNPQTDTYECIECPNDCPDGDENKCIYR